MPSVLSAPWQACWRKRCVRANSRPARTPPHLWGTRGGEDAVLSTCMRIVALRVRRLTLLLPSQQLMREAIRADEGGHQRPPRPPVAIPAADEGGHQS